MKKEAKRSAIEVAADEEGKGEADLRFKSLLTGCMRLRNDLYCVGWGVKLYSLTHA